MRLSKRQYRLRNPDVRNISTSYEDCEVDISYKDFIKLNRGFMMFIKNKILDGESVVLPVKSGKIEIIGKKVKPLLIDGKLSGLAPDWVSTKELWKKDPEAKKNKKLIYHFNEHTNGIRYSIHWYKLYTGARYRSLYAFYAVRTFKREIWKRIMGGKEYRLETKISLYEQQKLKNYEQSKIND